MSGYKTLLCDLHNPISFTFSDMLSQTYSDWSSIWPTPSTYEPFDYSAALRPNDYTFSGDIATINPAELKTSLDDVAQPVQEYEETEEQEEISIEEPLIVSIEEIPSDVISQPTSVATDSNFLSPNTGLVYPRSPVPDVGSSSSSPLSTSSVLPVSDDASDIEPAEEVKPSTELVPPPKRPRGRPKKTSTFKIPYATPPPANPPPSPGPSSKPPRRETKPRKNRRKNDESDYELDDEDDEDYDDDGDERPRKRARKSNDEIKCTVKGCSTTFGRYADMRRHWENRHSGRTYACRICDLELSRPDARLRHERSVHGQTGEETNSEPERRIVKKRRIRKLNS